jgi:hypothetical protein
VDLRKKSFQLKGKSNMKDTVLSVLRHFLTAVGASLVAKGYLSNGAETELIGAVIGLIGAAWGPIDEYLAAKARKGASELIKTP